jgi:hypothetical protein
MYCWYYSEIDRFAVTKTKTRPPIEDVCFSVHYSGLEYYRYLPLDGLLLQDIERALRNNPREICFEITPICNLMCPVCIARAGPHSDLNLSLLQFEGWI